MFVKKFSADTLDEALKTVKKELGPDAIILKTTSNRGGKGFLKKKIGKNYFFRMETSAFTA